MKRLFIVGIISLSAFVQSKAQQVTFGVKGGFSLANQQIKADNDLAQAEVDNFNDSKKMLPAFHGGVTADIALSENIVVQPALQFAQKGIKFEFNDGKQKLKNTLNYLELPINVLYRQSASGGFYGGVGPYVAYALNGKYITQEGDEPEEKKDVDFDTDNIKRFDAGANFMVGYELPMGVTVGANYSLGFININDDKDAGIIAKNNYIGISVGYKFKRK